MAQPPHFDIKGVVYFVTTRLKEKERFFTDHEFEIVQKVILNASLKNELIVYAYVIMPDHMHLLSEPLDMNISKAIQLIKGRSSRKINSGNIWQKGFFDFVITSEKKFRDKFNLRIPRGLPRGFQISSPFVRGR